MTTYKFRHEGQTYGPYSMQDVARLAPNSHAARAAAGGDVLESTERPDTEGRMIYESDRVDVEVREPGGDPRMVRGTVVWTGRHWGVLPDAGQGFVRTADGAGGRFPLSDYRCTLITE